MNNSVIVSTIFFTLIFLLIILASLIILHLEMRDELKEMKKNIPYYKIKEIKELEFNIEYDKRILDRKRKEINEYE